MHVSLLKEQECVSINIISKTGLIKKKIKYIYIIISFDYIFFCLVYFVTLLKTLALIVLVIFLNQYKKIGRLSRTFVQRGNYARF